MNQKFIDIMDFSLKYLEKSADYAEARLQNSDSSGFTFKNGILEESSSASLYGLGLRFTIHGNVGFLSTNVLDKTVVKRLIDESIRTARASRLGENLPFSEEKPYKAKYSVPEKIRVSDFSAENKIGLLREIDSSAKKLAQERYFSIHDSTTEKIFANSDGASIYSRIPRISFYYNFSVISNGKSSQRSWMYGASSGYEIMKKWNLPSLVEREARALGSTLKSGIAPPKGDLDIVCSPEIVAIMVHESVGHPYEADRILGREAAQAGESFVNPSMLNSRIGSECVNVADDPTIPNSYGHYLFDDEGVKAGKRLLIKNGMINEFLHSRQTAFKLGVKSNAAARAVSYAVEPIVRMANTYMVPGNYSEEELIEGVKNGVYFRNFMEWNIDDVRLNQKYVGAEAYLIKNGRISVPVVNPAIEITTPKLYSSIDAVANNLEFHSGSCGKGEPMQAIPVWFGGASIRMRKIRVNLSKK
ncbi:MAG: TldD/PmbA family protein [Candidatus Woesearchaeota archaeon]|nr:TldD/PmbA family protein [Candidatus Woesearchaeota archaeon]